MIKVTILFHGNEAVPEDEPDLAIQNTGNIILGSIRDHICNLVCGKYTKAQKKWMDQHVDLLQKILDDMCNHIIVKVIPDKKSPSKRHRPK